jgi:hypothetical protein
MVAKVEAQDKGEGYALLVMLVLLGAEMGTGYVGQAVSSFIELSDSLR